MVAAAAAPSGSTLRNAVEAAAAAAAGPAIRRKWKSSKRVVRLPQRSHGLEQQLHFHGPPPSLSLSLSLSLPFFLSNTKVSHQEGQEGESQAKHFFSVFPASTLFSPLLLRCSSIALRKEAKFCVFVPFRLGFCS